MCNCWQQTWNLVDSHAEESLFKVGCLCRCEVCDLFTLVICNHTPSLVQKRRQQFILRLKRTACLNFHFVHGCNKLSLSSLLMFVVHDHRTCNITLSSYAQCLFCIVMSVWSQIQMIISHLRSGSCWTIYRAKIDSLNFGLLIHHNPPCFHYVSCPNNFSKNPLDASGR